VSRILIVDADAVVGPEVRALLASDFHDTVLVKDATGGILELASSRFDLVIIDLVLSRMDGVALITRLRSLALTLPIIGITGVELSELMRPSLDFSDLAIEAGATCCLRRSLAPRQLLEAVNSNLGLQNENQVATLQLELSAETSLDPKVDTSERAIAPREFREALAVLRKYVQELRQENEGNPYCLESIRDTVTSALMATEQAFQIIEPTGGTQSEASDTAKVIVLNNRAIELNPALQSIHSTISPSRERLTPRERQVLALVTDGVSNKVGGFRLSISVRTFETHRANVMGKLGAKNAAELVRFGLEAAR
jgi:DNA-binding NarL/FixJ family response regulator